MGKELGLVTREEGSWSRGGSCGTCGKAGGKVGLSVLQRGHDG